MRTYGINGNRVLTLSRDDLAREPFNINDESEIDHMISCIENLRNSQIKRYMKTYETNVRITFNVLGFCALSKIED